MKILLGILLGFCILFALFFGYRKVINPYYKMSVPKFVTDTSRKMASQEEINDLKSKWLSLETKVEFSNKRMDDLFIFCGIVITLLLAINVTVFVNTDRQVKKYLNEHFEIYKSNILKISAEVEEAAGKIKAELEIAQQLTNQAKSIQPPNV